MNIDSILEEFATATDLPVAAVTESVALKDLAVPVFLSLLERASDTSQIREDEERSLFLVIHVLAELEEKRACLPLLNFLTGDQARVRRLLGQAITETLTQVMISVFDGDVGRIVGVMENDSIDEFVRSAAFGVWTYLALDGVIGRDQAHAYLEQCPTSLRAPPGNYVWTGWADAIVGFHFDDLMPLVKSACGDRIDPLFADFDDFESDWAQTGDPELLKEWMDSSGLHPFGKTVVRLSDWRINAGDETDPEDAFEGILEDDILEDDVFLDEFVEGGDRSGLDLPPLYARPVANPHRHVGRNDPCPCGSGKKFKKCCLQAKTA